MIVRSSPLIVYPKPYELSKIGDFFVDFKFFTYFFRQHAASIYSFVCLFHWFVLLVRFVDLFCSFVLFVRFVHSFRSFVSFVLFVCPKELRNVACCLVRFAAFFLLSCVVSMSGLCPILSVFVWVVTCLSWFI